MSRISTRGWAAALTIGAVLGTIAIAVWKRADPAVAWLDGRGPARWIVYPSPAATGPRRIVELEASFDRSFHLEAAPASAVLRFRALRSGVVRINGREAAATAGPDWKAERRAEVAPLLRAGDNRIEASVSDAGGPPALWLVLEMPGARIVSDEGWTSSWAGAAARPAARATEPKPGRMYDPDERVMSSPAALLVEWRRLGAFTLLSALVLAVVAVLRRRTPGWHVWSPGSAWPLRAALGVVSLLWIAQFVNNSPWLPASVGFDAAAHLEYAQFIQDRHAIPFADDGWQMFQPPLYYLLLAAVCAAGGASPVAAEAATFVRSLGLIVGLAHLVLLGACMRLIFPERPVRQIAGLLVGAFLPCMLYLHQYPANEPLVAMLSTAGVLSTLHLLRQEAPPLRGYVVLGLVLGLALLAKVTALLLLPPVLGALAARALFGDPRRRVQRLAGAALSTATLVVTCGWYYARVWQRFGTPFVGGWDARRGMGWWMDPGYRTVDDFLRFGRAFTSPLFAGFGGVWDGLYVTLWGDGLLSGRLSTMQLPPWWSPSLMSAALLFAIVPAAAVLAGAVAALARWVRRPSVGDGVLVWLALLVLLSVLSMAVGVPAVAADKASYGLLSLVPFCAFAAHALGVAGRRRGPGAVLAAALGVWALASYSTYWIDAASGKARLTMGVAEVQRGNRAGGLALVREAHARDPGDWPTRAMLAGYLLQEGAPRAEVEGLLAPHEEVPGIPVRHLALARLAFQDGDLAGVEDALRRAVLADPDNVAAHAQLAVLAAQRGELEGAVAEAREALRIDPEQAAMHRFLAQVYGTLGDAIGAERHSTWAKRLETHG